MNLEPYIALLKDCIGLDAPSIGNGTIERAVRERAAAMAGGDFDRYWTMLQSSTEERSELIEAVVVPETWFFRDRGAFIALAALATDWLRRESASSVLKVLSIPCSTGEEPYSITMALLDAGLPAARFTVDAVDVSARALLAAGAAVYRKNSFRGQDLAFRDRYFERTPEGYRLLSDVQRNVRFIHGNVLAPPAPVADRTYDAVFCRNLLIYFDRPTQDRAVESLSRRLSATGALFVGPSETALMMSHQFMPAPWPGSFAFHRLREAPVLPRARPVTPPAPSRRRSTRAPTPAMGRLPFSSQITGTPAAAAVDKRSAVQKDSGLLDHAETLANQGNLTAARSACEEFLRSNPTSARAFYLLGLIDDSAGDSDSAVRLYRRVLYLEPDHHEALVHLAILLDQNGDAAAAQRLFERARRAAARGAS